MDSGETRGISVRSILLAVLTLAFTGVVSGANGAERAHAETCPNEEIRAQEAYASALPDCRAYEQVSPVDKNLSDALGEIGTVQASPSGGGVTFYSVAPFPGAASAPIPGVTYLSTRQEGGWVTRDLMSQTQPGASGHVIALNEGLSEAIIVVKSAAGSTSIYVRNDTGAFLLLAAIAEEDEFSLHGFTPDGSILFEAGGARYEWQSGDAQSRGLGLEEWETALAGLKTSVNSGNFSVSGTAEVLGILGSSEDGTYVYFAARGVLTSDGEVVGYVEPENADIYVWHEDPWTHERTITLVAPRLDIGEGAEYDAVNWAPRGPGAGSEEQFKTSRVSRNGKTLLFRSVARLTGYENAGHTELYRYETGGKVTCVSCNPTGAAAMSGAQLGNGKEEIEPPSRIVPVLTRNLSENGTRVFFDTEEALVTQDKNGEMDVYEWEREGEGTCERMSESFIGSAGGCLYLISTGQSTSESYFGDASANGNDAFLFTRQSLVSGDRDYNVDVYDARVNGGIAAQNQPPATPCASEEACRGGSPAAPVFGALSSASFTGVGNLAAEASVKPITTARSKSKVLTRAQRLADALKACARRPKRKRAACQRKARKLYGKKAHRSARVGDTAGRHH
jgi:hypothetical protein